VFVDDTRPISRWQARIPRILIETQYAYAIACDILSPDFLQLGDKSRAATPEGAPPTGANTQLRDPRDCRSREQLPSPESPT
jgi:hypothetical protein